MAKATRQRSRRRMIGSFVALGVAFVLLLGLGTWQIERLQWKERLLAEIEARRTATPVSAEVVADQVSRGADIDYVATTAAGTFDHAHELFFLATDDGQPGFYVYTPLHLLDGKVALVNRGFVPDELRDPARRRKGEVQGQVTITGLARARLDEKPSFLVPDNEPSKQLFFWKDMDAMATAAGVDRTDLLPFFIDADAKPNPGGYPKGGVTQIDLPNNHLSYALTWYGLAAAMVFVAALAFRNRAR